MENTAHILASSQVALRRRMEVVSNNIANMNTPGYKADKAVFKDVLVKNLPGAREYYVHTQGTYTDFAEGSMKRTSNQFDVALGGEGFLVVNTPSGERYTRAGRLQLNAERELVTSNGFTVRGQNGSIVIPPGTTEILINQDGSITANEQNIDRLQIVRFENNNTLEKAYGNMYVSSSEAIPVERPNVLQGMLEASNVQAIAEVTKMMNILRSYQSVSRAVKQDDAQVRKMIEAYSKNP